MRGEEDGLGGNAGEWLLLDSCFGLEGVVACSKGKEIAYITTISMIMPIPNRRKNDIASFHSHTLPMDSRKPSFTLDDETHGECNVTVGWCCLVWHDELETTVDRVGGIWCFVSCWVNEHENPAFCLFLGDEFTGADEIWTDVLVAPDVGRALRIWFWWVEFGHLGPEGEGVCLVGTEFVDEAVS